MPELPEVETIRRTLRDRIRGRVITGVRVLLPKIIKYPEARDFPESVRGRRIMDLHRRGKYLLFRLNGAMTMVIHLRMTGQLTYSRPEAPLAKHTHLLFALDDGQELRFHDQRQFGTVHVLPDGELNRISGLHGLGPEPLEPEFTVEMFGKMLAERKRKVKEVLLDQTFMAGIGNIYADEALFVAGIHPERPANGIDEPGVARLFVAILQVLREGITYGGTTVRDYVDGTGQQGNYQHRLRVYDRERDPCPRCGQPIARIKVGGRSSYFCPDCQD